MSGRLEELARRPRPGARERCELCAEPIPERHRHLLDLERRELRCCCRACALLFDRPGAGGGHYRLVPERRLRLGETAIDDAAWAQLGLPVDIAFCFHSTAAERVQAFYPGPMGATESLLALDAWQLLEAACPALATLEPDVEALLVDRTRGHRRHWIAPLDDCYALVGAIRSRWRGLTGGRAVWEEIDRFLDDLDRRSKTIDEQELAWQG